MGVLNALQGSTGSSFSNATSANSATSSSRTYGAQATQASIANANTANAIGMQNWQTAAAFNAEQAAIQREWQERMANTVYQRTVKDMIKAGINPVLAANMGLGTASVGSGASASMGNADSYMASAYADQISSAESQGQSQSQGQSFSESGLATGLKLISEAISGLISNMNSAAQINFSFEGLDQLLNNTPQTAPKDYDEDGNKGGMNDSVEGMKQVIKGTESIGNWLIDQFNPFNSPLLNDLRNRTKKAKEIKG